MSESKKVDKTRRNLVVATSVVGGAASVGAAIPFAASWLPSERAKAAGAPVEADISRLEPGQIMTVEWRSKPVWVVRRTKEMLDSLKKVADKVTDPKSEVPLQPEYAKNETRSIKPEYLVVVGICSHLGCSPTAKPEPRGDMGPEWEGGFYCPCHGSKFDLAGRVFKGAPAPVNLEVPRHAFLTETTLLIGDEKKGHEHMASRLMALWDWVDARMPTLAEQWRVHASEYYAPKNFNFWYYFGSLAILALAIQIVSGIYLTMFYKPDAALAFGSVEYIMRDVPGGWIIRYVHSTGSSLFFLVVYLHMFRAMLYGSYRQPRELLWIFGVLIYLSLMAEAFFGYLLPWGQMSYWGAQVIVNLFAAVPFIGEDLALWIRGDYVISDATLNRFFALHVIAIPLALLGLVAAHILALHDVGSNNPDGIEIKKKKDDDGKPLDGIPFHPYYTVKDVVGAVVFMAVFAIIMFFMPEMGGYFLEYNNFIPADPLKTPTHIAPVWYFTPYYSMLRAVPPLFNSQFPGVMVMGLATLILFLLPWIDRSPVKSIRYRGAYYKSALAIFVVAFLVLGYLGTEPTNVWGQFGAWLDGAERATVVARVFTLVYFLFFILMPWYTAADRVKPEPERVTM